MNMPVLQTERLILRLAAESDIPAILHYYTKNAAHFAPTDPPRPPGFLTEERWKNQLEKSRQEFLNDQSARFFLFNRKDNAEVIGTTGFTEISRGPFQACYLGYGIGQEFEGKGLMTEALQTAIPYIFTEKKIHRIMANHLVENQRSANLLQRLGFVKEGIAKEYLFVRGAWRDHVLNSLTNREWKWDI